MAKVKLTPRAEDDLFEIWLISLQTTCGRLLASEQPLMGATRPELSATARILVQGRYVVIYEPQPDGILVVTVVHGMRDPESWLA